jgi:hypothetical protein
LIRERRPRLPRSRDPFLTAKVIPRGIWSAILAVLATLVGALVPSGKEQELVRYVVLSRSLTPAVESAVEWVLVRQSRTRVFPRSAPGGRSSCTCVTPAACRATRRRTACSGGDWVPRDRWIRP